VRQNAPVTRIATHAAASAGVARHRARRVTAQVLPDVARQPIPVPQWIATGLAGAWQAGRLALLGAPTGTAAFEQWSQAVFPQRPPASQDQVELAYMHTIPRTAAQTAQANWLADDGDMPVWDAVLAEWQQTVGPRQAAWGYALLHEARDLNARINAPVKEHFGRTRPYRTDPSIDPVVPLSSAGSPSYPSGHAARAYLEATILAALMPARAPEFFALAQQMAMSRIYGGVHFPSDTFGGAWEGALVASWLLRERPRPTG
jgi:hypothetical protein